MKLVLSAICVLFLSGLQAQIVLFSEDFEGGFNKTWQIIIQDTNVPSPTLSEYTPGWIVSPDRMDATDSVVGACSFFNPAGKADRWLISEAITLGTLDNVLFWSAHSVDPSFPEKYSILLSTTGNNVADFTEELYVNVAETPEWRNDSVSLTDLGFDSQIIYLAFVLQTSDGFVFEMDDIKVIEQPLAGLNNPQLINLSIYPNPVNDVLEVKSELPLEQLIVLDLNGKILLTNNENSVLNTSSLHSGLYFLKVFAGNEWQTLTFNKL